jgi:indolepyruvate ferredoxin oxidoreductase
MRRGDTTAIVNSHDTMPGSFTQNPDLVFPHRELVESIEEACGKDAVDLVEGTLLATSLLGDSIATNLFMLGYAWQQGHVPLSYDALMRAIELNGVAVDANKRAFNWGRYAAHDIDAVRAAATPPTEMRSQRITKTLDDMVEMRIEFLTAYQNGDYAQRFADLVQGVASKEKTRTPGKIELAEAVARYYFKLLAYKDEYEVARLYTQTGFMERLEDTFEGNFKVHYNLAPPLFARRDPVTGHLRKKEYGRWMYGAFKLLAGLRGLRGTPFDIFGYSAERRMERRLITEYEEMVGELLKRLSYENHCLAVEIASLPEHIRGFGRVKEAHLVETRRKTSELLAAFGNPETTAGAA